MVTEIILFLLALICTPFVLVGAIVICLILLWVSIKVFLAFLAILSFIILYSFLCLIAG